MTSIRDEVAALYAQHPYPKPPKNLKDYFKSGRTYPPIYPQDWLLLWPNRDPRDDIDIMVAGCGTMQAAIYAYSFPKSRIVGIDLSDASLAFERHFQELHGLDNLTLHKMPIEEAASLGMDFDLICSSGVLHHMEDPDAGLRGLGGLLRPEGRMMIMVYGRYGRAGIYMLQDYCRTLGVERDPDSIEALRQSLAKFPAGHPVQAACARFRKDMQIDACIADTFLHPRDRAYTTAEALAWLERCGLEFQRWQQRAPYLPQCSPLRQTPHYDKLRALPLEKQYEAMELYWGGICKHNLIVCPKGTPASARGLDFHGPDRGRYRVQLRADSKTDTEHAPEGFRALLALPNREAPIPPLPLTQDHVNIIYNFMGKNPLTIAEIAKTVAGDQDPLVVEGHVAEFVELLYDFDLVAVQALPAP